jgi:hypothetical protein
MRGKGFLVIISMTTLLFGGCKSLLSDANHLNAFTIEQDKELGDQVAGEIASKPSEYPILPEKGNEKIYGYIRGLTNSIIQGEVSNTAVNLIGRLILSRTTRRSMLFVHQEAKYMYIPD